MEYSVRCFQWIKIKLCVSSKSYSLFGCYNTIRTCLEYCKDCVASYVITNSVTATANTWYIAIHDWHVTNLCCIATTIMYMLNLLCLAVN